MGINYFNKFSEKKSIVKTAVIIATCVLGFLFSFFMFYTPTLKSIWPFISILAICFIIIIIQYRYISPMLMKRIGIIYFLFVLVICVAAVSVLFIFLFESKIIPYPEFGDNYVSLIPLAHKVSFIICVSVLLFVAARFLFLFFNTFQLSEERYHCLINGYMKEIDEMRLQTNPYFFYNSLNNIDALLEAEEFEKAYLYNMEISALLNKQLIHSHAEFITLEEELDWLKHYMNTQRNLVNDQFDYTILVNNPDSYLQTIPPFILQPIVETLIHPTFLNEHQYQIIISIDDIATDKQQGVPIKLSNQSKTSLPMHIKNQVEVANLKRRINLINSINKFQISLKKNISDNELTYLLTVRENTSN